MIVFKNATKKFGSITALRDVSFEVKAGELTLITGSSGSGKTTLMKLITREYQLDEGEIEFDNQQLTKISKKSIPTHRRKIGVVFQDYKLLDELNVWENIALALSIVATPKDELEERVTDLLKLVELTDRAYHFPNQLSGGEAQRVSIARALSTAPMLLFADEPTGNLDSLTSKKIINLLTKINNLGTTIIVTSHDPLVIDALGSSQHIHLDNGRIANQKSINQKNKSNQSLDENEEKNQRPSSQDLTNQDPQSLPAKGQKNNSTQNLEQNVDSKNDQNIASKKTRFGLGLGKIGTLFGKKNTQSSNDNHEQQPKLVAKDESPISKNETTAEPIITSEDL